PPCGMASRAFWSRFSTARRSELACRFTAPRSASPWSWRVTLWAAAIPCHDLLALACTDDQQRRFQSCPRPHIDGLLQFGEFFRYAWLQGVKPPLVARVIGGQVPHVLESLRDEAHRLRIRFQILYVTSEEIAALPGLSVVEQGQHACECGQHLLRVDDP